MSISALGSVSHVVQVIAAAPSRTADFQPQMVALGKGRAHGRHTQAVGADPADGTTASASLADDTRALVGDVFGALGADTPNQATAQQAVAAYRRTTEPG